MRGGHGRAHLRAGHGGPRVAVQLARTVASVGRAEDLVTQQKKCEMRAGHSEEVSQKMGLTELARDDNDDAHSGRDAVDYTILYVRGAVVVSTAALWSRCAEGFARHFGERESEPKRPRSNRRASMNRLTPTERTLHDSTLTRTAHSQQHLNHKKKKYIQVIRQVRLT